jgi:hypothetical protein
MACGIAKFRQTVILGLTLIFALSLFVSLPVARATEGVVIYDARDIGGLHFTVLASPNPISVGAIHLFVRIAQPAGLTQEAPYRGARLLIEFYPISGPGADKTSYVQRRDLIAPESEPGTYELSDSLQNEGTYQVTLTIQNTDTPISTSFTIDAKPEPDDRFLSVLLISLFPIFLAWLIWMYLKRPGGKPGQPGDQSNGQSEQTGSEKPDEALAASHTEQ